MTLLNWIWRENRDVGSVLPLPGRARHGAALAGPVMVLQEVLDWQVRCHQEAD